MRWSDELQAWLLSDYRSVVAVLDDPRFSAALANAPADTELPPPAADPAACRRHVVQSLQKQLHWAQAQMQMQAQHFLAKINADGAFDAQRAFILPCCQSLAFVLLGIRPEEKLLAQAQAVFEMTDGKNRPAAEEATIALATYFLPLLAERRHQPQPDLLSALAVGEVSDGELLSPVIQLFVGLATSLPLFLGNSLAALLAHPAQKALYLQNPEQAGSELLRYAGPAQLVYRIATQKVEIGEMIFKKGQKVALLLAFANRDARVFEQPGALNLARNAPAHLALGRGAHACLGAAVLRSAAAVLPFCFLNAFPKASLVADGWKETGTKAIRGVGELLVRAQNSA